MKRALSWAMLAFSISTTPPAMALLAHTWADRWIILLGGLGLTFPAVGNLWQAEQMEDDDADPE